ncbi:MAG: HEAT repeat domain-containing protein, partial [Planctomycetota bacterium]
RRRAINEISNADWGGQEVYVKVYYELVNDPDPTVRAAAIRALGLHGSGDDAPAVIPYLKAEASFERWEAAAALQRLHNDRAIEPLINTLRNDTDVDVRQAAANALGQYPDSRVFDALLGTLTDLDYSVVEQSAESLETITGQNFGDDGSAWLKWSRESTSMFTNAQAYYYPQFDRPRTMLEKMQFWKPKPEPIQPQAPRGSVASTAASLPKPPPTPTPQMPVRPVPQEPTPAPSPTPSTPIAAPQPTPSPATSPPYRGDRKLSRPRGSNLGATDDRPGNTPAP